jgi:hypothetical protein
MTLNVGGIATRKGLDRPGVESQWEATFIAAVQTGPGAHPVSHTLGRVRLKRDGTRAETRLRLSAKRTSPFKSAGASVQSTAGSRGVRISVSNVGYTTFRGSVRVLATHSIRQFPLHFPLRAAPCAIRFQTQSTGNLFQGGKETGTWR